MCPRRALALGLQAAAALGLLAMPAAAAPQIDCRPGAVAFETVPLPGRNVTLLRRGPGCPELAPDPPTTSTAPRASAGAAEASLVDDAPGGAFLAPSSALHGGSPHGHVSAGLRRSSSPARAVTALGVLATMVLLAAISWQVWDRNVRRPRLLAQKAAEDEAERARLASEEAERQEELGRMARAEAEKRAREEAEQRAREEATALAQRALQEQEKAIEAAETAPVSARSTKSGAGRGQYDDHTRAFQLARQKEEEERRAQQERDDVHKKGQDTAEAKPEKKGLCGPCGCSSGRGAAEPGRR